MKSTEHFKETIKDFLDKKANKDSVFAERYANPKKKLDDCVTYILNTVKKTGCVGFADDEIYGMALHYYDEDNVEVGSKINCNVVVNHKVELTEADKQKAKEKAMQELIEEQKAKLQKKPSKKVKKEQKQEPVLSLF